MVKKISNKKVGIISNTVNLSKNSEETSLAIEAKRALAESVKIWHETIKRQEDEAKEARIVGEKMKNAFDELYSNILKQMDDKLDLTQMKYDELCEKYKQDGVKLQEQYEEKNRKLEETYVQRELELNANYKKLHIDLEEEYKKKNNTVVFEYNDKVKKLEDVYEYKTKQTKQVYEDLANESKKIYDRNEEKLENEYKEKDENIEKKFQERCSRIEEELKVKYDDKDSKCIRDYETKKYELDTKVKTIQDKLKLLDDEWKNTNKNSRIKAQQDLDEFGYVEALKYLKKKKERAIPIKEYDDQIVEIEKLKDEKKTELEVQKSDLDKQHHTILSHMKKVYELEKTNVVAKTEEALVHLREKVSQLEGQLKIVRESYEGRLEAMRTSHERVSIEMAKSSAKSSIQQTFAGGHQSK